MAGGENLEVLFGDMDEEMLGIRVAVLAVTVQNRVCVGRCNWPASGNLNTYYYFTKLKQSDMDLVVIEV